MRDEKGRFVDGIPTERRFPVGTIRIRTRHGRGGERRAYVKVAEPNVWELNARYVWQKTNGPIPDGMAIHHRDGDKLNDALENLELVTIAGHLELHRPEFADKCVSNLVKARRERRWSTKSTTKRTGRPPSWNDVDLERAVGAYLSGGRTLTEIAAEYNIPYATLGKKVKAARLSLST